MTKNCHKVVRKYLTRNVKFMNIIPGCNTKVEGQKVVNKNWLMLCKWPEEASVRVWPNMSLQRAQAGMFVFPVFKCEFSSMNTAKYSWHKQQKLLTNIHKSCVLWSSLSSLQTQVPCYICAQGMHALLEYFFVRIKLSGPKPQRSIPIFVTRVDSTMSTLSCLNMRIVIDGVEFYLARVYSLPAQTSFS